jgi:hypothetical protein
MVQRLADLNVQHSERPIRVRDLTRGHRCFSYRDTDGLASTPPHHARHLKYVIAMWRKDRDRAAASYAVGTIKAVARAFSFRHR